MPNGIQNRISVIAETRPINLLLNNIIINNNNNNNNNLLFYTENIINSVFNF